MRIHKVPRAWLDDPGTISRGAGPGRRGRPQGAALAGTAVRDRRGRNEAIARTVFAAYERQDTAAFRRLVAPDARMRIEAPCEGAGDFVGATGVTERFARSSDLLGPDASVRINDVLASDSHAAVLFEVCDQASIGSCAQRVAVYRLSRGRIKEIRVHQEPSSALNA